MNNNYSIPAQTRIGHVHLKVSNLQQSVDFYCGLLGFGITVKYGDSAVGLYHTAILYPTRKDLAAIYKRLIVKNYPLSGAADHGVSEALYLNDPDGNGVELYWDRPQQQWPQKEDGSMDMFTHALDLDGLLNELA